MNSESPPASDSTNRGRPDESLPLTAKCPHSPGSNTGSEPLPATVALGQEAALPAPAAVSFKLGPAATATPHATPERIGRYRVIRELGRGGFGTVYLAHDAAADRLVAIKLPRADRMTSEQARQAFLFEARHVAKLKHPSIVTLYEVGEADGQCYLVYEYIE